MPRATATGITARVLLACAGLALPGAGAGTGDGIRLEGPLLNAGMLRAVVASLARAPDPVARADLAWIALDEMAAGYRAEAERAARGERVRPGDRDVRGWAAGAARYADELEALASGIEAGTPVTLGFQPDGSLRLLVSGRPVLLSGPQMGGDGLLAGRVLARFCSINVCPEGAAGLDAAPEPVLRGPRELPVSFSFADDGEVGCLTADGLHFVFRDRHALGAKKRACAVAAAELRALGQALQQLALRGVTPVWERLRVLAVANASAERVELNRRGDYLELSLPALASSPRLVEVALPWLQAAARGEARSWRLPHAELLLSVLLAAAR